MTRDTAFTLTTVFLGVALFVSAVLQVWAAGS